MHRKQKAKNIESFLRLESALVSLEFENLIIRRSKKFSEVEEEEEDDEDIVLFFTKKHKEGQS